MLAIGVLDGDGGGWLLDWEVENEERVGNSGAGTIATLAADDGTDAGPADCPEDPLDVDCSGDGSLVCWFTEPSACNGPL